MIEETLNLKVGVEILLKIESLTENIRKVGVIRGWINREMIIIKVSREKNLKFYETATPLLVGFVNEGITYGFKSRLIMRMRLLKPRKRV